MVKLFRWPFSPSWFQARSFLQMIGCTVFRQSGHAFVLKKFLRIFMPLPDSAGGAFFRKNRALENSGKTRCRELQKFIRILLDFLHGNPGNGKNCGRKRIAFRKKS
ncbi:MAG: hypothetical protein ACLRR6_01870 [Oscillospiraceae bacterium]